MDPDNANLPDNVYNDLCGFCREMTEGQFVGLIVVNGIQGSGFAIQIDPKVMKKFGPKQVANLLHRVATGIETEARNTGTIPEEKGFSC